MAGRAPACIANLHTRQTAFVGDQIRDPSRTRLYAKLSDIAADSGDDATRLADLLCHENATGNAGPGAVTQNLKGTLKYHRTRNVHTTPTVVINSTGAGDVSSGWGVENCIEKRAPLLA